MDSAITFVEKRIKHRFTHPVAYTMLRRGADINAAVLDEINIMERVDRECKVISTRIDSAKVEMILADTMTAHIVATTVHITPVAGEELVFGPECRWVPCKSVPGTFVLPKRMFGGRMEMYAKKVPVDGRAVVGRVVHVAGKTQVWCD